MGFPRLRVGLTIHIPLASEGNHRNLPQTIRIGKKTLNPSEEIGSVPVTETGLLNAVQTGSYSILDPTMKK